MKHCIVGMLLTCTIHTGINTSVTIDEYGNHVYVILCRGLNKPRHLTLPISKPLASSKCQNLQINSGLQTIAKHDLLVWSEICELAPNGEYVPVAVDIGKHNNYQGEFLLRQGIQRRFVMSSHTLFCLYKMHSAVVILELRTPLLQFAMKRK